MNQSVLSKWLKNIIIGVALCGLVIYLNIIPSFGQRIAYDNPEFAYCYWPWLIFIWITAIPCYAVLVSGWLIAFEIGKDNSFSQKNATLLKRISVLSAFDACVFFIGNLVLGFLNMSHPGILLYSLIIVFIGIAISVASAALSHLVLKAAELREENEMTI